MNVFWITFRLAHDATHPHRHRSLREVIVLKTSLYWNEPTAFYLVQTDESIDALAQRLKGTIDPQSDMILIKDLHEREARLIGTPDDDDVIRLLPYVKRA